MLHIGIDPGKGGGIAVYYLSDPNSPAEVRYIGWATNPSARLKRHVSEASKSPKTNHKLNWIRSLLAEGREPLLRVVATAASRAEAAQEEIRRIAEHRALGCDLTNSTAGGDGVVGWTPELRAHMSAVKTGLKLGPHSEETKRKISAAQKGRPCTPAQAAAIELSAAKRRGTKEDPAVTERRIAKLRGRKRAKEVVERYLAVLRSPEVRAKLSEAAKRQWAAGRGWSVSPEARAKARATRAVAWKAGVYDPLLKARGPDGRFRSLS